MVGALWVESIDHKHSTCRSPGSERRREREQEILLRMLTQVLLVGTGSFQRLMLGDVFLLGAQRLWPKHLASPQVQCVSRGSEQGAWILQTCRNTQWTRFSLLSQFKCASTIVSYAISLIFTSSQWCLGGTFVRAQPTHVMAAFKYFCFWGTLIFATLFPSVWRERENDIILFTSH